jgi:hypothetical protein
MAFADQGTSCWINDRVRAGQLPRSLVGSCDGVLIRGHLIPKQRITRERIGAEARRRRGESPLPQDAALLARPLDAIVWDVRVWVPMCGGLTGIGGHHGKLDGWQLRIRRAWLPARVEEFAEEYGLGWSLERDYGPKETT